MADEIFLGGEKPKAIHPAGTEEQPSFPARCVDAIDLGENPESFGGKPAKLKHKGVIVWYTGEINPDTQKPFEVSTEYTLSLFEGSNLRNDLEGWRGKPYTPEQIEKGDIPLHKLVGQWCLLTIAHVPTQKGRLRAKVVGVSPLHPAIPKPTLPPYTRAEFWDKKKAEYAEAAGKHRQSNTAFAQEFEVPEGLDAEGWEPPF